MKENKEPTTAQLANEYAMVDKKLKSANNRLKNFPPDYFKKLREDALKNVVK
jgi:hypothetical protein